MNLPFWNFRVVVSQQLQNQDFHLCPQSLPVSMIVMPRLIFPLIAERYAYLELLYNSHVPVWIWL